MIFNDKKSEKANFLKEKLVLIALVDMYLL